MKLIWLVIAGAAVWACKVPNLDHCYHQNARPNTWCAENHPSRPYCSPCEEENGCVSSEPSIEECPDYIPGTGDPGTDADPDSDTETDTGTGSSGDAGSGDSESTAG